jgi:hypothetical protein
MGLWDVEAATFCQQPAHRWRYSCRLHAPAALYAQEKFWYSFLLEAESTQELSVAGRIESIGKSDDIKPANFQLLVT